MKELIVCLQYYQGWSVYASAVSQQVSTVALRVKTQHITKQNTTLHKTHLQHNIVRSIGKHCFQKNEVMILLLLCSWEKTLLHTWLIQLTFPPWTFLRSFPAIFNYSNDNYLKQTMFILLNQSRWASSTMTQLWRNNTENRTWLLC